MNRAIVLLGHGSRDAQWREPMDQVARRIRERFADVQVRCAFLELSAPDLATAVAELAGTGVAAIRIVPMFLGAGRHVREDVPRQVASLRSAYPALSIELQDLVGEHPQVLDLLAQVAASPSPCGTGLG